MDTNMTTYNPNEWFTSKKSKKSKKGTEYQPNHKGHVFIVGDFEETTFELLNLVKDAGYWPTAKPEWADYILSGKNAQTYPEYEVARNNGYFKAMKYSYKKKWYHFNKKEHIRAILEKRELSDDRYRGYAVPRKGKTCECGHHLE